MKKYLFVYDDSEYVMYEASCIENAFAEACVDNEWSEEEACANVDIYEVGQHYTAKPNKHTHPFIFTKVR